MAISSDIARASQEKEVNHYEVTIQSTTVVYVAEARDESEAIEFAKEHATGDSYTVKLLETDAARDSARRHADAVSKA
jgi:hypothetical protein